MGVSSESASLQNMIKSHRRLINNRGPIITRHHFMSASGTRLESVGRNYLWWTVVLSIGLLGTTCDAHLNGCAGLRTGGRTWPAGDIILEYGEPLRILCTLDERLFDPTFPNKWRGKNSSDLVFFRGHDRATAKGEAKYVTVVNETTIELYVEKPSPAEDSYTCVMRLNSGNVESHEALCLNLVRIGFKPEEPKNFSCVSRNWQSLECTWQPVPNYIPTEVSLQFKLPGRAARLRSYPCPGSSRGQTITNNSCVWSSSTNPIYRQAYEYYIFMMEVKNVKGYRTFFYNFHHYAHVIPSKPATLTVVNTTTESALLHWVVPYPMENFPPGLHHRITHKNQWENQETWQIVNITNAIHHSNVYYNLTGLKYANTVYDARVYMKSAVAIGEDRWSDFSSVTFKTAPKVPGLPPRTDIGSFEVAGNNVKRDVYLYWQVIPRYLGNGDNFRYHIASVEENGRKIVLQPNKVTSTYAKFEGLASSKSYRFEIETINELGANERRAEIYVPSDREMPHQPIDLTNIVFDGGLHELSWKPPKMNTSITSYTIFWCDNGRDQPDQCTGYLDWIKVPGNTTVYNITVPNPDKLHQFAISANTDEASSGMLWASCTVIRDKVIEKLRTVWINRVGSHFIEVLWRLECTDRIGIVKGLSVHYCPIAAPYNMNCIEPETKMTVEADSRTVHSTLIGLKPNTYYMLALAVLRESGEGLPSDPMYISTFEDTATVSRNVHVSNVTNTSMEVPRESDIETMFENTMKLLGTLESQNYDEEVRQEIDEIRQDFGRLKEAIKDAQR